MKTSRSLQTWLRSAVYLPQYVILIIDIFLSALAYLMSVWIAAGIFTYDIESMDVNVGKQLLIVVLVQVLCYRLMHTYKGILRFSTFVDIIRILGAVGLASGITIALNFIIEAIYGTKIFITTTLLVYFLLFFLILCCLRVGAKTTFEYLMHSNLKRKRVLIYGCDPSNVAIAKMLRSDASSKYKVAGFINDDPGLKSSHEIAGLHVYANNKNLIRSMKQADITHVIISPNKIRAIDASNDLTPFLENDINVLTTPDISEWNQSEEDDEAIRWAKINTIKIEDLLLRPTIKIDMENVRQTIRGKVVMVTGAAGSIGSELVRQIITFSPKAVILFELAESPLHDLTLDLRTQFPKQVLIPVIGDVRNPTRVEEIFAEYRPDVIYHAAAYKHVPLMEHNPNEAICANVLGTRNMADMAVKYEVERFVMISTDKAVNPSNVMGASKRIAEIYVQSLAKSQDRTIFVTTRFGNVLGSNGSVIPYFKKQIAAGGPVTVTHPDIIRYFMTIPEACTLVLEASTLSKGGDIFVFDMGQPVKILDLAKNMIRLAGFVPGRDIKIEFTGLRPGEKLYEELLNQKETTLPTQNPKIMVAKVREYRFDEVAEAIHSLITIAQGTKPFLTVKKMKEIVPEFKSRNSEYEFLDQ